MPLYEAPGQERVLLAPAARQPAPLLSVHPLHLSGKSGDDLVILYKEWQQLVDRVLLTLFLPLGDHDKIGFGQSS